MERIEGGYYIKARSIQNSAIMKQPPYVREIWDWLLKEANHKDVKINGKVIKRGQLMRSMKEIREGLTWYIGYRKMVYCENHTKRAMKFLRKALMIDTTREPGGLLITICNYDYYQNPENYERTNERTNERPLGEPSANRGGRTINKKEKNDKNVKNEKNKTIFDNFRQIYPGRKRGLDTEFADFCKKHKDWREVLPKLLPAVQAQKIYAVQQKAAEKFVPEWKDLKSWLYNRYWETIPETKTKPKPKCFVCGSEQTTGSYNTTSGPRHHCANDDCKKKIQGW